MTISEQIKAERKHGGKREGAGRKKGEETTTISFRVPTDKKESIKNKLSKYLKKVLQVSN